MGKASASVARIGERAVVGGMSDITDLATLGIAGAVAIVTYRQWRAAQEQHRVDLFELRFATYRDVVAAVSEAAFGDPDSPKATFNLADAYDRASFLFDSDVSNIVHGASEDVAKARLLNRRLRNAVLVEEIKDKLIEDIGEVERRLMNFKGEFTSAVQPYLAMRQKRPSPSIWWPW